MKEQIVYTSTLYRPPARARATNTVIRKLIAMIPFRTT